MKTIMFLLLFVINIFALPDCCLLYKYDSLKAVPDSLWSKYPITHYTYIEFKNSCDSIKFRYEYSDTSLKRNYTVYFVYHKKSWGGKILDQTMCIKETIIHCIPLKYKDTCEIIRIKPDTTKNWCDSTTLPAIEKTKSFSDEKILNVKIFDIQGKLIYSGKTLNINNLSGLFLVEYITDKRIYFKKKLFY